MNDKIHGPKITEEPEVERITVESLKEAKNDDVKLKNSDIFSDFKLKDK
jgi:hypothetical protein